MKAVQKRKNSRSTPSQSYMVNNEELYKLQLLFFIIPLAPLLHTHMSKWCLITWSMPVQVKCLDLKSFSAKPIDWCFILFICVHVPYNIERESCPYAHCPHASNTFCKTRPSPFPKKPWRAAESGFVNFTYSYQFFSLQSNEHFLHHTVHWLAK